MKIDLTKTTSSKINAALMEARRTSGSTAAGMVLTLVIVTDEGSAYDALKAANDASREHPMRTLAVIKRAGRSPRARAETRLDAEILVGSDAGSGETVILRMPANSPRTPSRRSCRCCCRTPRSSSGGRTTRRCTRRRTRWARSPSAGSPTPSPPSPRSASSPSGPRATPRATPTWPGPGSPAGVRCWPPRWTSGRPGSSPRWSRASPTTPASSCSASG